MIIGLPFNRPSSSVPIDNAHVGDFNSPSAIAAALDLLSLRGPTTPNTSLPLWLGNVSPPPTPTLPPIPLPPTPPPSLHRTTGKRSRSPSHTDSRAQRKKKPYSSGQRCIPSDPKRRVQMRVMMVFWEVVAEVGLCSAEECFEGVLQSEGRRERHDGMSCPDCWYQGVFCPCIHRSPGTCLWDDVLLSLFAVVVTLGFLFNLMKSISLSFGVTSPLSWDLIKPGTASQLHVGG